MADDKKTTVFGNSLIWFGAAVSIAEILTGALLAPLGFRKGLVAIVLGHLIGCVFLYAAGTVGARYRQSAMEAAKRSFGELGGRLLAGANVVQLVGWTAVMIAAGGQAAQQVLPLPWNGLWAVIIGAGVLLWNCAGFGGLRIINLVSMVLLLGLSLLLSKLVYHGGGAVPMAAGGLGFGEALELSIAMPVSWLPLIADYISNAERPKASSAVSAGVYFLVSCWMYLIGLGAALYAGQADIVPIMVKAGFGYAAVLIVLLSTITTTFLDVFSAGISFQSITARWAGRKVGAGVCLLGTLLAIFCNTGAFEGFLYWIGSIFVPMAVVQIADVFCGKREEMVHWRGNILLWFGGFLLYRLSLACHWACGSTVPAVAGTILLCLVARGVRSMHSHSEIYDMHQKH